SFYAFQRSLEAYRASFKDGQGVIVLDKNDPFLQYMRSDR
ncbi:MAG: protease modulator HflC, partial [Stenotrophomonas acidaminiphila]